jgi:PIN domain nuclease of toxin-antitoxin system
MTLLLDTCTFLWIIGGFPIPPRVLEVYRAPDNEVYLSAASAAEIVIKYSSKKPRLTEPPNRLVPAECEARGILPLPVHEESALHVSRLPPLHVDPFDRFLVAQAIVHGQTILTPDSLITQPSGRTDVPSSKVQRSPG